MKLSLVIILFSLSGFAEKPSNNSNASSSVPKMSSPRDASSMEKIEIFGQKSEWTLQPKTNSELERWEIEKFQAITRDDLFRGIPGVTSINDRPLTNSVLVRGLINRSLEVVDGARHQFQGGHLNADQLDPFFLQKVSVKNNSQASTYGSGSIGGTILYQSVRPSQLIRSGKTGGQLFLQTGDNVIASQGALVGYQSGRWSIGTGVVDRRLRDRRLSDQTRMPLSAMRSQSQIFKVEYETASIQQSLAVINRNDFSEAPLNPISNAIDDPAGTERNSYGVRNNLTWKTANGQWRWHVSAGETEIGKSDDDDRDDTRSMNRQQTRISQTQSWTDRYSTYHELDFFRNELDSENQSGQSISTFPSGSEREVSLHSRHILEYENFGLQLGARWTEFEIQSGDQLRRNQQLLPEARWTTLFNTHWSMDLGYSRSYQNPSIGQIFPTGLHFPGFRPGIPNNFFAENRDLKPELADQYEASLIFDTQKQRWRATYFQTQARDFIFQQVDVRGGQTQFINIDGVTIEGLEGEAEWRWSRYSLKNAYSIQWIENQSTGTGLVDQPSQNVMFTLSESQSLLEGWDNFIRARYFFTQNNVSEGLPERGGAAVFDLGSSFEISSWRWQLNVRNIFDRQYAVVGSPYVAPGRAFVATGSFRF